VTAIFYTGRKKLEFDWRKVKNQGGTLGKKSVAD